MYPPIPLPARAPVVRAPHHVPEPPSSSEASPTRPFDLPPSTLSEHALIASRRRTKASKASTRAQPIEYTADRVRRQFFRDHPFEALRPRSIVERDEIDTEDGVVKGKEWTRLRQRGRNPSPDDAVAFAVSLYEHRQMPLSSAYAEAITQFRALRSEQAVATSIAQHEARFYGAQLAPSSLEKGTELTGKALATWGSSSSSSGTRRKVGGVSIKNRFFAVWKGRTGTKAYWSRGEGYVRRWMRGMPPDLWPAKAELRGALEERRALDGPQRVLAMAEQSVRAPRANPTLDAPIR